MSDAPNFAIGSDVWPGLAKLGEECGELVQVINKVIAMGGTTTHWDGSNLEKRLAEEMGDVQAALQFMQEANPVLNKHLLNGRAMTKVETFRRWHYEQT